MSEASAAPVTPYQLTPPYPAFASVNNSQVGTWRLKNLVGFVYFPKALPTFQLFANSFFFRTLDHRQFEHFGGYGARYHNYAIEVGKNDVLRMNENFTAHDRN